MKFDTALDMIDLNQARLNLIPPGQSRQAQPGSAAHESFTRRAVHTTSIRGSLRYFLILPFFQADQSVSPISQVSLHVAGSYTFVFVRISLKKSLVSSHWSSCSYDTAIHPLIVSCSLYHRVSPLIFWFPPFITIFYHL